MGWLIFDQPAGLILHPKVPFVIVDRHLCIPFQNYILSLPESSIRLLKLKLKKKNKNENENHTTTFEIAMDFFHTAAFCFMLLNYGTFLLIFQFFT